MFGYNYETKVESAFIIRIKDNAISEELAQRCADSCEAVEMPYQFYSAVDGTSSELIITDNHPILKLVKLTNEFLSKGEVACFLSHFLLWVKCVEIDKPIVILEHDAVMIRPYLIHPFMNIVSYLGCSEQVNGWTPQFPLPPHGQLSQNYRFMCRAHAYAIDPMIARQLVAKVIKIRRVYISRRNF